MDKIVIVSPEPAYLGRRPLGDHLPREEWRPTVGFSGYEVSSLGRVMSYRRQKPRLLAQRNSDGYRYVNLVDDRRHRSIPVYVHRLVLEAFECPRPHGLEVRHLDGVRSHNVPDNLAWGNRVEQVADMDRHGTSRKMWTHCRRNHPFNEANTLRRKNGRRMCRACHRLCERQRRHAGVTIVRQLTLVS